MKQKFGASFALGDGLYGYLHREVEYKNRSRFSSQDLSTKLRQAISQEDSSTGEEPQLSQPAENPSAFQDGDQYVGSTITTIDDTDWTGDLADSTTETGQGTATAYDPIYVDMSVNGDWLQFYGHDGMVISTTHQDWHYSRAMCQGMRYPCFLFNDDTGYSYYTWSLDTGARETTEQYLSESSAGNQPQYEPLSTSYDHGLSDDPRDPLRWNAEETEEYLQLDSAMDRLTVGAGNYQTAEGSPV